MGEEFDFGSLDAGEGAFDISSLLGGNSGIDFGSLDAGPGAMDLSGLEGIDLSALVGGDSGIDLSGIDLGPEAFDIASLLSGDSGGIDFGSLDAGEGAFDLSALLNTEGGEEALSRSLSPKRISLADLEKDTSGGTGLKLTGRGQMSAFDPVTGATGITGEGFSSIEDLLGSGTKEEIARYTPGTADYSLRSGLETEGGQGLNADATRGMSLDSMGGGQGLSKYIPAQYFEGSTTPIKGTGGTLSETGFLSQSSAANPLGSKYSLGDPKSFINNPTITGQQSVVSPGRTIIDNKDGLGYQLKLNPFLINEERSVFNRDEALSMTIGGIMTIENDELVDSIVGLVKSKKLNKGSFTFERELFVGYRISSQMEIGASPQAREQFDNGRRYTACPGYPGSDWVSKSWRRYKAYPGQEEEKFSKMRFSVLMSEQISACFGIEKLEDTKWQMYNDAEMIQKMNDSYIRLRKLMPELSAEMEEQCPFSLGTTIDPNMSIERWKSKSWINYTTALTDSSHELMVKMFTYIMIDSGAHGQKIAALMLMDRIRQQTKTQA